MKIGDKNYALPDLLRRANHMSTLYGARRLVFADGSATGLRVVEVKTAGGLRLLLNQDRCLDILELSYKGVNIGFMTCNGPNHIPGPRLEPNQDFSSYWSGGMLATCGLRNTGPACEVGGEIFPKQGGIGLAAADELHIDVNDARITVSGLMRESAMGRYALSLRRTITIDPAGAALNIQDTIRNDGPKDELLFLMYHINFGFPFLDVGATLDIPQSSVIPRDEYAAEAQERASTIEAPQDHPRGVACYFHLREEKNKPVTLTNHECGIRAAISYDVSKLPILQQWNSWLSGNYALGLEPSTSKIRGRLIELQEGYERKLGAFQEAEFGLGLDFSSL